MLESFTNDETIFLTLTYNDENLPKNLSLNPDTTKLFIDRLRKKLLPKKIRFYLVGEYGDETHRPHYHLIIFGLGHWAGTLIDQTWINTETKEPLGFHQIGDFNEKTAQYTCGYVVKKLNKNHPDLKGRYPEYSRMSQRPGLGANAMVILANTLTTGQGVEFMHANGDVPHVLKIGKKSLPLGQYLRNRLKQELGMPDKLKEQIKDQFMLEQSLIMNANLQKYLLKHGSKSAVTTKSVYLEEQRGALINTEGRANTYKQRKTL